MSRHSRKLVFAVLGFLLVGVGGRFISDDVWASQLFGKRVIYLQATQSSPSPQPTASPTSQPVAPSSSQPQQTIEWSKQYPSAGVLAIVILLYLGILGLRPTWLLLLPLDKIPKTPLSPEIPIPPAIGSLLKYRPRVLDAWVNQRIVQAQEEFNQRRTVGERNIHIPIPVELNGNKSAALSADDLKTVFSKRCTRLLILGEGGVGKTSLACQVAKWAMAENKAERLCKHRMLPVLIEEELESDGKTPLLEVISRQIKNLRDDEKPVSEELLKQLLEKRRILVIVDHLSEMSEATRKAARLRDASSPVNALVVTSRISDILGKEVTYTVIKPQRVSGEQLSIFMDAYLTQLGKRDLFDDAEYFGALRRLSQIVTGERDITVLFAKLYADQMIALAEGLVADNLPDNVPDLMLKYINEVNREKDGKIDDRIVQRDAKLVAWECLKQTFKPETAEREQVINCLAASEGDGEAAKESAKKRLQYLEERLGLIRIVPPAKTKIRFALDPLAEYLAGLHVITLYSEDEQAWQAFLEEARNKPGTLQEIQGFLLAVRDCCISKVAEAKVPISVIEELGELAGLDLNALKREQLKRRVRDLTSDLSRIDARDRVHAAKELGNIGSDAEAAVLPLISRVLKDSNLEVRRHSIAALKEIGLQTESEQLLLLKALDDSNEKVCISLVEILTTPEITVGLVTASLLETLKRVNFLEDENGIIRRRQGMLRSLHSSIEQALMRANSTAVPALIEILNNGNPGVRDVAMSALQMIGSNNRIEPHTESAILALANVLDSENIDDRRGACFALQNICSETEEALISKVLIKALDDNDQFVRILVSRILIKIKPQIRESASSNLKCNI